MRHVIRGLAVVVLALGPLLACAGSDDGDGAAPTGDEPSGSRTGPGETTAPSLPPAPPTTEDLDGEEPDAVEPPPADGVPTTALPSPTSTRVTLAGFGEVVVEVRDLGGGVREWCVLLAETAAQRSRGLMEVTDPGLGGYDGMLFRFESEIEGGFYMRNTPMPLSIAYLDRRGGVVSISEMDPCEDRDGCPTDRAGGRFQWALEVPIEAGGVAALGVEPGVEVLDTGRTCST